MPNSLNWELDRRGRQAAAWEGIGQEKLGIMGQMDFPLILCRVRAEKGTHGGEDAGEREGRGEGSAHVGS